MTLYKGKNISFYYNIGNQKFQALKNIDIEVPKQKFVCLSGPSGSGKSTLLNLLGLIETPQEGELFLKDENLATLNDKRKNSLRRYDIGFIFQKFHLFPVLSVEENIAYFLRRQKHPKSEIKKRTLEAIELVGLKDHGHKKPSELSGGQQQRVAIARAMAKQPKVIIGDEITASLDQKTGRDIIELLVQLIEEKEVTVVIATHDPMVLSYADITYHIQDGSLETIQKEVR